MGKMLFLDKTYYNAVTAVGCNVEVSRDLDEILMTLNAGDTHTVLQQTSLLAKFPYLSKAGIQPYRKDITMAEPGMTSPFFDQPSNPMAKLKSLSVIVNLNGDIILTDYTDEETPLDERIVCALADRYGLAYAMRSPFWNPQ